MNEAPEVAAIPEAATQPHARDQPLLFPIGAVWTTALVFAALALLPLLVPPAEHPVSQVQHPRELALATGERPVELAAGVLEVARDASGDGAGPRALEGVDRELAREGGALLLQAARDVEAWREARAEKEQPRELEVDLGELSVELRVRASALLKFADPPTSAGDPATWREPLEDAPPHPLVDAARAAFGNDAATSFGNAPPPIELDGLSAALLLETWYAQAGEATEAEEIRSWRTDRAEEDGEAVGRVFALVVPLGIAALVALLIQLARGREAWIVGPFEPGRSGLRLETAIAVFAAYAVAYQLLLPIFGRDLSGASTLLASLPLVALLAFSARRVDASPFMLSGLVFEPGRLGRGLIAGLIGALMALVGMAAIALGLTSLSGRTFWENPVLDIAVGLDQTGFLRLMAEGALWAPIFEELGFRGVLFAGLRTRMGFLPAALASAVAFGVVHAYDPVGQLAIVWVGFLLAWLFERTKSLIPCIVAHSVYNATQFAFLDLLRG